MAVTLVSYTGDGVAMVALVLLVADNGQPTEVGILLLAQTVPRLIGPLGGAIADRGDRRLIMVSCELGQAVVYGVIAALLPSFAVLVVLVAVASLLAGVFGPTSRAVVPSVVGRQDLVPANALLATTLNMKLALGGIVGGVLATGIGVRGTLLANVASFVASATFLAFLPSLRTSSGPGPRPRLGAATWSGLTYAVRNRVSGAVVVSLFVVVSFAALDNIALPFLARQSLHGGASGYGVLVTAYGIGMLVASFGVTWAAGHLRARSLWFAALILNGVGFLATRFAPGIGVAGATYGLAGVGVPRAGPPWGEGVSAARPGRAGQQPPRSGGEEDWNSG